MTTLGFPIFGSAYFTGAADATAPVDPTEKVKPVDALDRQQVWTLAASAFGFGSAPPPSDAVWWKMRWHATCDMAYAVTAGPIFAGTRTLVIRNADGTEGTPPGVPTGVGAQVTAAPEDKRKKLAEDVFESLWTDILCGLESLHFGRWTQEVIWDRVQGVIAPVEFRSFLPWDIQLLRDRYNRFAGFKHNGEDRDARYAWHAVSYPQFDPLFGIPRAEAAREAWWRSRQTAENGDKLQSKASGVQQLIHLPTGVSWKDKETGAPILNREAVQTIANSGKQGIPVTVPIPWTKEDIKANPALADISLIRIEQFNWGNQGPDMLATLATLDHLDKEIFLAWHRPPREALEGQHGTKAEAGEHRQVGIVDSELVANNIYGQWNAGPFNRFLVTNWGPKAAGSMYWKPAPLADPQQAFRQEVAKALLASPTAGPQLQAHVDGRRLLKDAEVPLVPEATVVQVPAMPDGPTPPGEGEADPFDELALSASCKDGDGDGKVTGPDGKDNVPVVTEDDEDGLL